MIISLGDLEATFLKPDGKENQKRFRDQKRRTAPIKITNVILSVEFEERQNHTLNLTTLNFVENFVILAKFSTFQNEYDRDRRLIVIKRLLVQTH